MWDFCGQRKHCLSSILAGLMNIDGAPGIQDAASRNCPLRQRLNRAVAYISHQHTISIHWRYPEAPLHPCFFSKMKPHFQCLSFETSPVHAHIPVSFLESHSKPVGSCGGINRVTPPHQVTWQKTCLWTIWCLTLTKGLAKLMDINAGRLKNQSDNPYLHVSCAPL